MEAPAVSNSKSSNSGDRPVNPCKNSINPPNIVELNMVKRTIFLTLKDRGKIKSMVKARAIYAKRCMILSLKENSLIISGGWGTRESISIARAVDINTTALITNKYFFIDNILKTGITCCFSRGITK